jgi:hypothetical protein
VTLRLPFPEASSSSSGAPIWRHQASWKRPSLEEEVEVEEETEEDDFFAEAEATSAAVAKGAARAASKEAHMGQEGGINASVLTFARDHLGLPASLDPNNKGRLVVTAEDLSSWVLAELERQRRSSTAELASKQAAAVAVAASSAVGFWWVVPKLLAV